MSSTEAIRSGLAAPAWPRHEAAAGTAVDRLLRALLCVFVATLAIEGPLRGAAALSGWPNLLYLRDAIPAGSVAVLVLRRLVQQRWLDGPVLLAAGVLAVHALAGLVLGLAPFQVALGLKTFLYLLYGLAMWPLLQGCWPAVVRGAGMVLAVSLGGLAANVVLGPLPWEGLEYETAFGTVTTTWRWWIDGGIPRLPGLARTSFNAAMVVGVSAVVVMAAMPRAWLRAGVAVIASAAILVTTSKGMLLAFPLAAAWLVLPHAATWHARAGRSMVGMLCATGLLVPLAVVGFGLGEGARPDGWPDAVHSVWERFSEVWPEAFGLLPPGPVALLGAGVGSIGTPQLFGFHPHLFNPADSFAVFLLVEFGVPGVVYYLLPALLLRGVGASAANGAVAIRACTALLVIGYAYGVSISMVEETFFATALGLALGAALSARECQPPPG